MLMRGFSFQKSANGLTLLCYVLVCQSVTTELDACYPRTKDGGQIKSTLLYGIPRVLVGDNWTFIGDQLT
jgi:hypothetical protein